MLLGLQLALPHTGSPGLFGPRNPGRVQKEYPRAGPQKSRKSAPQSFKRVRKESKSQVLDSFRTLLRLRGALFRDFWGPLFFGLFRGSRARRAQEALCGVRPIAILGYTNRNVSVSHTNRSVKLSSFMHFQESRPIPDYQQGEVVR